MKITIYDLLGMIKDGKAPKKIKYKNIEYEYEDIGYYNKQRGYLFDGYYPEGILDDEIEILDEPKKINKIRINYNSIDIDKAFETGTITFFRAKDIEIFQCLSSKINEIIDKLNNL